MVIIAAVTSERFRGEIKKPRPLIVRSKDEANRFVVPPFFVPDSHPATSSSTAGKSRIILYCCNGRTRRSLAGSQDSVRNSEAIFVLIRSASSQLPRFSVTATAGVLSSSPSLVFINLVASILRLFGFVKGFFEKSFQKSCRTSVSQVGFVKGKVHGNAIFHGCRHLALDQRRKITHQFFPDIVSGLIDPLPGDLCSTLATSPSGAVS